MTNSKKWRTFLIATLSAVQAGGVPFARADYDYTALPSSLPSTGASCQLECPKHLTAEEVDRGRPFWEGHSTKNISPTQTNVAGVNVTGVTYERSSSSDGMYSNYPGAERCAELGIDADGNQIASPTATSSTEEEITTCRTYPSMVRSYCLAWKANDNAGKIQVPLIALDVVAAGLCWAACAATAVAPAAAALAAACSGAGVVASVSEIVGVQTMKRTFEETAGQDIAQWAGAEQAVAVGAGVSSLAAAGYATSGKEAAKKAGSETANSTQKTGRALSCLSAVLYTGLAAGRTYSATQIAEAKKNSCTGVEALLNGEGTAVGDSSVTSGTSTVSGSTTSGSGGGTSMSSSGASGTDSSAYPTACADGLSSCGGAEYAAATDGQMLMKTGMDRALGRELAGKDLSDLLNKAKSGDVAGAIASAAQGFGMGDTSPIAEAVKAFKANSLEHLGGVPEAAYASGGRGGGGGGGKSDNASPFGSLFGDKSGGLGGGGSFANFGARGPASGDIWHTGTDMNLFEIVSKKIESVKGRVERK